MASLIEIRKERLAKAQLLRNLGINPYPSESRKDISNKEVIDGYDKYEGKVLSLAGRLMSWRDMGEIAFGHIKDESAQIQLYIHKDDLVSTSKENQTIGREHLNLIDIGDFIEAKGKITKTKRGEISLAPTELRMLSKSIRPLPEKWEGLKDVEERYRKRYLDLLMNDEVKAVFKMRAEIIAVIRDMLNSRHFLEVVTPTLQNLYGGASARPFKTHINAYDEDVFLRIAPELYLKRLLAGGYDRVFEFTTNFRNEGVDREHNPEFSVVEWYVAYKDYTFNMKLIEEMFENLGTKLFGTSKFKFEGEELELKGPYPRKKYGDIIKENLGVDIESDSDDILRGKAKEQGLNIDSLLTREILVDALFKTFRSKIMGPLFITDYPQTMFPLAKPTHDGKNAEVFQFYLGGFELVKAFTELNDPQIQLENFKGQENQRAKGDEEAQRMDYDFVESMEYGMPPNSGVGVGIDRLVVLLTHSKSIRDVVLFPFMKEKMDENQKEIYNT